MPDEARAASFEVEAASVQRWHGKLRLLVRTREYPASALVFSEQLGQAVGRELCAPPPPAVSTLLSKKSAIAGGVH